jgi:hypothetical protein
MAPARRQLRWQMQRLLRPARCICQLDRDDNCRMADSILVAGTARRSETTWLGDVLAGENGRILSPCVAKIPFFQWTHLGLRPERELAPIEQAVKRPFPPSSLAALGKPSATTTAACAVLTGENRVTQWQNSLTTAEIGQIPAVVAAFGLDGLYGDSPLPQTETIGELRFDIT